MGDAQPKGSAAGDAAPEMTSLALVRALDGLLQPSGFRDYCPNGLQVAGRDRIRTVMTAVTASLRTVEAAAAQGVDALLVHHGWFWKGEPAVVTGPRHRRLRTLLVADINLIAYHLPLDAHPQLGNNVALGQRLGWPVHGQGGEYGLLAWTDLPETWSASQLADLLALRLDRAPLLVGDLHRPLRRIAWCTGGAQDYLEQAVALGADAFISGEISERTTHLAREWGIVYAAAGHHATERWGVQALGGWLAREHGLHILDFDDPNPV